MKPTHHTHDPETHVEKTLTAEAKKKAWETQHNMAVRNAPHASGTTSEIAQTLGISKSEVRRLKREGRLDQALDNNANP